MKFYQAKMRHARYYRDIALIHIDDPDRLKDDFPQVRSAITWLMKRNEEEASRYLLEFVRATTKYHQIQSLNRDLVIYCGKGLEICRKLGENQGWLHLIRAQAYFALGEWKKALADAKHAVHISAPEDTKVYAHAVLELGRMLLNTGAYHDALNAIAEAEKLLTNLNDFEGVTAARREIAAYYHNRGEYHRALQLYLEIDQFEQKHHPKGRSEHTLFMLGVVSRKLGDYLKAKEYLSQLLQRGEAENQYSTIATATHHLAWVYLDCSDTNEAQRLGEHAKDLYLVIDDLRGLSDAEEQLGAISFVKGDLNSAKRYFAQSITTRYQLGNRHGVASSLRRLARCYIAERRWLQGLWYLGRSIWLYLRLGMLSKERLSKILR